MDLCGKLLVAMPGMADPRFDGAVILICAHSDDGAMGLIINKVVPELSFGVMLILAAALQSAVAGVFSVTPVRIYMAPKDRAVAVTIGALA